MNGIIKNLDNPNIAYESLLNIFFEINFKYFPKVEIKIKAKNYSKPLEYKKHYKKNYIGFLKSVVHTMNKNTKILQKIQNIENLFETVKKKAKKMYFSNKLLTYTGDLKKTWNIRKDIIEKTKK